MIFHLKFPPIYSTLSIPTATLSAFLTSVTAVIPWLALTPQPRSQLNHPPINAHSASGGEAPITFQIESSPKARLLHPFGVPAIPHSFLFSPWARADFQVAFWAHHSSIGFSLSLCQCCVECLSVPSWPSISLSRKTSHAEWASSIPSPQPTCAQWSWRSLIPDFRPFAKYPAPQQP